MLKWAPEEFSCQALKIRVKQMFPLNGPVSTKKFVVFVLLAGIFSSASAALDVQEETVDVYLDNSTIDVSLQLSGLDSDKLTYVTSYEASDASLTYSGRTVQCSIRDLKIGSELVCPVENQGKNLSVNMSIEADGLVTDRKGPYEVFRYSKTFARTTDLHRLKVHLPPSKRLADASNLSIERLRPPNANISSDGRSIFIEWVEKPVLGDSTNFQIVMVSVTGTNYSQYIPIIFSAVTALFLSAGYAYYSRHGFPSLSASPSLTDDEQQVYDLVSGSESGMLQKRVVDETGYSKAKISEVVDQLVEKKVIEKKKEGRTNRLTAVR